MFAIVAEKYQFVVGADTHARKHVAVVVNSLGVVVARTEMKVTAASMKQFVGWVMTKVGGDTEAVLFAIEGTSSYGETLTSLLLSKGLHVVEVKPPKTKSRGGVGKTDRIDAELAARSVLGLPIDKLILPRQGGSRRSLRILLGARRLLVKQQTISKNVLVALLRGVDLGIDVRDTLVMADYQKIAKWRIRNSTADGLINNSTGGSADDSTDNSANKLPSVTCMARSEAKRLARQLIELSDQLDANYRQLQAVVSRLAPSLLKEPGIGVITLAQIVCAYSHKGRIRSAEAFAALAGTTPIPASSGNTTRYRLNRFGDRQLNHALHVVVLSRMRCDDTTKQYVTKIHSQGMSARDIKRSLKRYVARQLYKQLEACDILL